MFKHNFNKKINLLIMFVFAILINIGVKADPKNINELSYTQRPEMVKKQIHQSFNSISEDTRGEIKEIQDGSWTMNGEKKYYTCGIDDEKLILDIIAQAPTTQKEFYFIDIGAGKFQWVDNIAHILSNKHAIFSDKKFHIIGLNGEGKDETIYLENIIIYKLGGFEVENMIEAFKKRGMDLDAKVDLLVSQYCLIHLIDPLGTFLQMLKITKSGGYILLDGLPFLKLNTNGRYIYYPNAQDLNLNAEQLLQNLKQPYLMCPSNDRNQMGRHYGIYGLRDILIQKSNAGNLITDMFYANKLHENVCEKDDCYTWIEDKAAFISEDNRRLHILPKFLSERYYNVTSKYVPQEISCLYGQVKYFSGDEKLYDAIKEKKLFYHPDSCDSFTHNFYYELPFVPKHTD